MAENPLIVQRRGAILVLTLNRPAVRNAVDVAMAEAMAEALDELDADPGLRVGVLTGAGKGFCAGMDLGAFAETGRRPWAGDRGFAGIVARPPATPLVAALHGFAVAGGFEIALACDVVVAARGTKLGLPETTRGLVAAGGALRRLPRRLPAGLTMELALTGALTTAERLHAVGGIERLADEGSALDDALALAERIAANAPLAVAATKGVLGRQWSWSDDEFFAEQARIVDPVMASEDAREGARAFTQRRSPAWQGR